MDHDAWQTPYNPQRKHFRPLFPTREESIAYAQARDTKRFLERDSDVFMIKATDSQTQEIIGWATWVVHGAKEGEGKVEASYYPEGSEEREFAEIFLNGLRRFIADRVPRKHLGA